MSEHPLTISECPINHDEPCLVFTIIIPVVYRVCDLFPLYCSVHVCTKSLHPLSLSTATHILHQTMLKLETISCSVVSGWNVHMSLTHV